MDLGKLSKIKSHVLKYPLEDRPYSEEFAGLFLHSNSPFCLNDYYGPVRSFRVFSQYRYPIYFFISLDAITPDFKELIAQFPEIEVIVMPTLKSIIEFNVFETNQMLYMLPDKVDKLIYIQSDGFCLKPGWEELASQYDYLGAKWKEPIKVIENTFNLPPVQVGNGGCGLRSKVKCLQVLEELEKHGGQEDIVHGLEIYKSPIQSQRGSFLAEDLLFCYFGFGLGIFKPVPLDVADKFALEPVPYDLAISDRPEKPYFFHRVDE